MVLETFLNFSKTRVELLEQEWLHTEEKKEVILYLLAKGDVKIGPSLEFDLLATYIGQFLVAVGTSFNKHFVKSKNIFERFIYMNNGSSPADLYSVELIFIWFALNQANDEH